MNYFSRHWAGELSLTVSYWVNLVLLATTIPAIALTMLEPLSKGWPLRMVAFVSIATILSGVGLWLWGIVGVWRSADRHVSRGGRAFWAGAAKVMVLLGMLSVAGQLVTRLGPQLKEFGLIALGLDPLGTFKVTLLPGGNAAHIQGILREGAAKDIIQVLEAAPSVSTLVLTSRGGRLAEARELADFTRRRGLNTYVERICLSGCTFVFVAGRDRAALPNAQFGFHAPDYPGNDPRLAETGRQYVREIYEEAGLPQPFIDRALSTKEMWFPTRDELIRARVLTRIAFDRQTTTAFSRFSSKAELILGLRELELFRAIERRYPDVFNGAVDKSWDVKIAGGDDAAILKAMRSVTHQVHGRLVIEGDDSVRQEFAEMLVDQARTIRALSGAACAAFFNGELDATTILSKEQIQREEQWLVRNLSKSQQLRPRDSAAKARALEVLFSKLPKRDLEVIGDVEKHAGQPLQVCDAIIALYAQVLDLPSKYRAAALEGLVATD